MRFQDFKSVILEATVLNKYYASGKYIDQIVDAIKNGGPLFVTDLNKEKQKVYFPDALKANAIKIISRHNGEGKAPVVVGNSEDGEQDIEFQIDKIEKKFSKGDVISISVNVGNVTEGILGLSMAAKFSNTSKSLTREDVITLGKTFINSGNSSINVNVADRTLDKLQLKITLPSGDTSALTALIESGGNGKKVAKDLGLSAVAAKKLDSLIDKCVNYANTGEAPKSAIAKIQEYYQDEVQQIIEVTSDGAEAENQNMTKVDLKLVVKGKDTETMSLLSLKAGSGRSQIGQASGKQFTNARLFWKQNFNYELPLSYKQSWDSLYDKLANEKGKVPVNPATTLAILKGPIAEVYQWAAGKISAHLAGDSTEGEVEFLQHLQKGLLYHSAKNINPEDLSTKTKGDESVIVTIIDFGKTNDFVELRFGPAFYNLMTYFNLESTGVKKAEGGKGWSIQIIVRPNKEQINNENTPEAVKNIAATLGSGKVLVQYRTYIQQNITMRNIVEVDKGAKILGALSNEQFKIAKAVQQTAPTVPQATSADPAVNPTQAVPAKTNNPNATI
jgi:hypothetical protein